MLVWISGRFSSPIAGQDVFFLELPTRSCLLVSMDGGVGAVVVMTKLLVCVVRSEDLLRGVEWTSEEDSSPVGTVAKVRLSDDSRHIEWLCNLWEVQREAPDDVAEKAAAWRDG